MDATVSIHNPLTALNGVTDRGAKGRAAPPDKLNVETGPPLVDILMFSFLYVVVFCVFRGVFVFFS